MLKGITLVNKKADEFDDKIYNLKNKCDNHSLMFSYIDNLLSDYQYQYCDNIMDDMNRDDLRGYNSTSEFVKELDNDLAHLDNVIANSYLLFVNVIRAQDELDETDTLPDSSPLHKYLANNEFAFSASDTTEDDLLNIASKNLAEDVTKEELNDLSDAQKGVLAALLRYFGFEESDIIVQLHQ